MSKGPWAALAVLLLVFGLITLTRIRPQPSAAPPAADGDSTATKSGVRAFWEVYRRATDARMAGRLAEAGEDYRRALALDPRHEDALYYLGNVELELGRYRDAESAWQRLVELNPASARTHSRLGDLYACVEPGAPTDLARAEREFRQALALNREETGPLLRLGELALVRGRFTGAIAYFDTVIGFHLRSPEAHLLKGYALWKQGQPGPAASLFHEAVASAHSLPAPPIHPGEGDTKRGLVPIVAHTSRCHFFEGPVSSLAGVDSATAPALSPEFYRRLDGQLAALSGTAR